MKKLIIVALSIFCLFAQEIEQPIKIVYNSGTPPLKFTNSKQQADGMLIDIWKLWATKSNKKVEFIEASWDDTLLMVKDGRADVHGGLYYTKERTEYLDYTTKPLYANNNYFFNHKDIQTISSKKDILPFVVGIGNGYPLKFMNEKYSEVTVKQYASSDKMVHALETNEIKVVLSSLSGFTYLLKKHNLEVDDFKYTEALPAYTKKYFGAVKKDNDKLLDILVSGFNKITKVELQNIENKWTKDLDITKLAGYNSMSKFNKKELNFIKNNNTIKIVANPSWPPFDFINKDTNKPDGIAADYIKLISKETGLKFEYIKATSWNESIKKIQNKDIDIFGVIKQTPQRDNYLNFTNTYISFPMVAVSKNDIAFVSSIEDIEKRKFVMIKNFSTTEYLKTNYPDINMILVNDAKTCMDYVSKGKADVFIGSLGTVSYLLKEHEYVNLKIAGKIGIQSKWGIGIRNDISPELISILNKSLKSITQRQKDEILNKWITVKFDKQVDYTLIYQIIGLFVFFIIGSFYWNRKLNNAKVEAFEAKDFASAVMDSQENFVLTSDGKCLKTANKAFFDFYEVKDTEEFISQFGDCICDTFDKTAPKEYIQKVMGDEKWLNYVYNRPNEIHKVIISRNNKDYIFTITAQKVIFKGADLKVAVLTNVTELEKQKNHLRKFFNNKGSGILIVNKERIITEVNPKFCELWGYSQDEIIGLNTQTLHTSEKAFNNFGKIAFELVSDDKSVEIEYQWKRKDNSIFWAKFSGETLSTDGDVLWVINDITLIKDVQEELDAEKELINSIMNSQDNIVLTSDGKTFRTANKAFMEFFEVKDISGFIDKFGTCVCDAFVDNNSSQYITKVINGMKWVDYILMRPNEIHKVMMVKNGINRILTVTMDNFLFKKENLLTVVFTDITELENIRLEAEETHDQVNQLLDNASQGFLYFNNDMTVGNECSAEVMRIFEKDLRGLNITTVLYKEESDAVFLKETLQSILTSIPMRQEILISLLEVNFTINNKFVTVEYKVLNDHTFMMILTDITATKAQEQTIKDEQQVLKMVVEVVTAKEQFLEIKSDYKKLIESIDNFKTLDKLAALRREIHTYKGLFAQKEMLHIVKELHEFESLIDESLKTNTIDEVIMNITPQDMDMWLLCDIEIMKSILGKDFFDKHNSMQIENERIVKLRDKLDNYFKTNNIEDKENLVQEIKEFEYYNIQIFFRPFEKLVEQLSQRLEKYINPLVINSEDVFIPNNYQPFLNSLVHIFRNSVDHGIENIEDRMENDKDDMGTILCDIFINSDTKTLKQTLCIKISDDGKGIDCEKIKQLSVKKGIYTQEEVDLLSEQEILLIIFKDEFSTSEVVTDISGRGVGLASIIHELNNLDGTLTINNNYGQGIEFTFNVPLK